MSTITTKDGTAIYCKDCGEGPAVTLSHGWPLSADRGTGRCCSSLPRRIEP
jgi:non-heme chloroperoxidase